MLLFEFKGHDHQSDESFLMNFTFYELWYFFVWNVLVFLGYAPELRIGDSFEDISLSVLAFACFEEPLIYFSFGGISKFLYTFNDGF